jgi:hypothetical protein
MSPLDYILPALMITFVVLAFTVAKDVRKDWKGIWRLLISIPISGIFAVPLNIGIGTSIDPTSHNLAPIEIVVWCGAFLFVFLLVIVIRKTFLKIQKKVEATK